MHVEPYGPHAGMAAVEAARQGDLELHDVSFSYPLRPNTSGPLALAWRLRSTSIYLHVWLSNAAATHASRGGLLFADVGMCAATACAPCRGTAEVYSVALTGCLYAAPAQCSRTLPSGQCNGPHHCRMQGHVLI